MYLVTSRFSLSTNHGISAEVEKSQWAIQPGCGMTKTLQAEIDRSKSILGLKSDKDWVFLANYRDPTHLMNTFVFIMGRGLGCLPTASGTLRFI